MYPLKPSPNAQVQYPTAVLSNSHPLWSLVPARRLYCVKSRQTAFLSKRSRENTYTTVFGQLLDYHHSLYSVSGIEGVFRGRCFGHGKQLSSKNHTRTCTFMRSFSRLPLRRHGKALQNQECSGLAEKNYCSTFRTCATRSAEPESTGFLN